MVGAHVSSVDPLADAEALGAGCIQLFLSDPQGWKKPPERTDAAELRGAGVRIYVHAPYLINVASPNNRIRIPSRKILQDTCDAAHHIGAEGVIVHAGHADDDIEKGAFRWRKALEELSSEVPVLIENTAGGKNALARRFDALERLWEQVAELEPGFCFDTCHAHAAGEDPDDAVARARSITGRIDLVHANDSKDPHGSGRDRHTNLGRGEIGTQRLRHMIRTAQAPVVCETPGALDDLLRDLAFVRDAIG